MTTTLQRQRAAVETARDAVAHARALADYAALLARHWRAGEAARVLAQARGAVAEARDNPAKVRLALAEAVVAYYSPRRDERAVPLVHEALQRAQDHGDAALLAECEAWAGHIRASVMPVDAAAAVEHLRRAQALSANRYPAAHARALYGLATLHQRAGLIEASLGLYAEAVRQARRAGDHQLLLAIHRYGALGQVDEARRLRALGQLDAEVCREILAGLVGTDALAHQLAQDEAGVQCALARAEMYSMMGRHADALALYARHIDSEAAIALGDERQIARCDRALCLARDGQLAAAREQLDLLAPLLAAPCKPYVLAAMASSLAGTALRLGDLELHCRLVGAATRHWADAEALRNELRAQLRRP